MRTALMAAALAACTLAARPQTPNNPLNGTWQQVQPPPRAGVVLANTFVFKAKGDTFSGTAASSYDRRDIVGGSLHGAKLSFRTRNPFSPDAVLRLYQGSLQDGVLTLQRVALVAQPGYPYALPAGANRPAPPIQLRKVSNATTFELPPALQHPPLPPLRRLPPNGLALTPPMGWDSWNKFAGQVNDADVRHTADLLVSTGMRDAGYVYVNIDDTWEGQRDPAGNIQPNAKFPDMKALAAYVHARGLKLGIYSSPGPRTCAGYEGSYNHEAQDARTYAAWGIDYLKYDWCSAGLVYTAAEMPRAYEKMALALRATGRPIVFSLCQYGELNVGAWGAAVGGNLWRTTGDISDHYDAMARIGFGQNGRESVAGPGHWNDPDMLEIGNGGMNAAEYRTHMSLWAILAAPLLAGNDLTAMTPEIRSILTNREVIAVDQDPLGRQGFRLRRSAEQEIWERRLRGGAVAVGLFNRATVPAPMTITWRELGLGNHPEVRNLWAHRDLQAPGSYTATVPAHGVILLRVH